MKSNVLPKKKKKDLLICSQVLFRHSTSSFQLLPNISKNPIKVSLHLNFFFFSLQITFVAFTNKFGPFSNREFVVRRAKRHTFNCPGRITWKQVFQVCNMKMYTVHCTCTICKRFLFAFTVELSTVRLSTSFASSGR